MFPQSLLQHNLLYLRETFCASRVKIFAEATEIFKQAVFQLVAVAVNPSRGRRNGSRIVLNLDSKEDEGK